MSSSIPGCRGTLQGHGLSVQAWSVVIGNDSLPAGIQS